VAGAARPGIDPGNRRRWTRELAPGDQLVFESVAGDLLRRLEYETNGSVRVLGGFERLRWRARDVVGLAHWRATTWDRLPRARTSVLHGRSLVLRQLGLTGASARPRSREE
jgi:hypothetical protein